MSVSGVNSSGSSTTSANSTTGSTANSLVDKNVFLKILVAELSNQDPMNPSDNTEYISQLAQFTSLEQTQNLNSSLDKLTLSQKFSQGNSLIGQSVEFNDNDKIITETVTGVKKYDDSIYLVTAKGEHNIDDVVSSTTSSNSINTSIDKLLLSQRFNEGTFLIGSNVEFNINNENLTELVTGVKIVNGSVYLITENGQRSIDNVVGVNIASNSGTTTTENTSGSDTAGEGTSS